MNFILYMLGRGFGRGITPGTRPTFREMLVAEAARHAARGRLDSALQTHLRLAETLTENTLDVLIRGHLHLVLGQAPVARECFAEGMELVLDHGSGDGALPDAPMTSVERLMGRADHLLRQGRYALATDNLRRVRAFLDVLQAAQAGLLLAESDSAGEVRLAALVRTSDLALRLLARTQLTRQLAAGLQKRRMREDLAVWATTEGGVKRLLEKEYRRLALLAAKVPAHMETAYRLGLIARATGRLDHAAAAFTRVLARHPQHISSAVGLAAIQADQAQLDIDALRAAYEVPAPTLHSFGAFAVAAGDLRAFDLAARRLEKHASAADRPAARANLAFALSEVGLLDGARAEWREVVPA